MGLQEIRDETIKKIREFGRKPDFIMINPNNKKKCRFELNALMNNWVMTEPTTFMGIPLIWTDVVSENEIVCTYK